jgi:hypothetical protein
MTKVLSTLAISASLLALSGFGVAYADGAAGSYALSLSHGVPCTVTLAQDGGADTAACNDIQHVNRWHKTGSELELSNDHGTVYAVLRAKGDGYQGSTILKNSSLTLTPTAETAALSH